MKKIRKIPKNKGQGHGDQKKTPQKLNTNYKKFKKHVLEVKKHQKTTFFAFNDLKIVAFMVSLKSSFSCFFRQGHADQEKFCRFLENAFTDLERGVVPKSNNFWTKTVIFGDFSVLSTNWNTKLVRDKNRARTRNMVNFH